jgi:putative flippase GtrA
LARELVAFGFAGVVNTGLGFLIFNLLLGIGTLTANAISTACATTTSFILNRHITYRHRPHTALRRELPLFVFFNLIALALQQVIMAGGKWVFGLTDADRLELNILRIGAVVIGTLFLLLTYRTFVFKKAPEMAADLAPEVVVAEDMADAAAGHAQPDTPEFKEFGVSFEDAFTLGDVLEADLRNRTTEEIDSSAVRSVR